MLQETIEIFDKYPTLEAMFEYAEEVKQNKKEEVDDE